MPVGMPGAGRHRFGVLVPMMRVVLVLVRMLDRFVGVLVLVALRDVQPYADAHQRGRRHELPAHRVVNARIAISAPANGATEKYAAVRAVPRWRNAITNSARLRP